MPESQIKKRKRGRPRNSITNTESAPVLALDRGLVVLKAIADLNRITLSDLAARVNMPASTIHRILTTLQSHGFVEMDERDQQWAIGIGAFRVGSTFLERSNLVEASLGVMRELTAKTGETANLGIAEAGNIVFVSQVETKNPIRAMFRQGTGSPMHASGIGKAMLADMPRPEVEKLVQKYGQTSFTPHTLITPDALFRNLDLIAQKGWAVDNEERYLGMRCVSTPVYNAQGEPIAGLSVSGPTARFSDGAIEEIGPKLREAAAQLTAQIGGQLPRP